MFQNDDIPSPHPQLLGLRFKILLGFGGLLLILVAVSVLGETVLDRYSAAMQRSFKEDYQSVAVCEQMAHACDQIDTALQQHFWQDHPLRPAQIERWRIVFDQQMRAQRAAATLPGESEATDRLARRWQEYTRLYPQLLDASIPRDVRQARYARLGLPKAMEVQAAAHDLIDMNMQSMLAVHDQARRMAGRSRWAMHVLTISAVALAVVFAFFIGRLILRPVRVLTDSVRQIEHGNLDLRVPVQSHDELGTLAAAINAMAAQLGIHRQADRERLARTERTTQLAIDSLPDAIVVLTPDGRIELANQTAQRLFQFVAGADVESLPTPWLAEIHRRILRTGHAAGLSGYESTIQLEQDGETRSFLPRTAPILTDGQHAIGATVVLADVTGLRRLDEMKNGLLSLVSHELKTPLTSMRMVLHLVTEEKVGTLPPRQKELLCAARDDAERLHLIIEGLLDMARIESGRALMELQPVSSRQLAEQAAAVMRGAFEGQQVELTVDAAEDLPMAHADAARIGHVLSNLLNNALRYTPAGGHVRLWARLAEDWIEMGVTDDGAGIPRAHLPRVFEKFYRAPGQPGAAGSGLGLSIVKDIVEAHGGQVRAQSDELQGSTFAFTLRRAIDN
ncbi:MAG TPA: ATP-binding protein [Tepidisphaeraceae bacterium]|nr:ATP-binding protein [Tepidisphaeraceae bacterium]